MIFLVPFFIILPILGVIWLFDKKEVKKPQKFDKTNGFEYMIMAGLLYFVILVVSFVIAFVVTGCTETTITETKSEPLYTMASVQITTPSSKADPSVTYSTNLFVKRSNQYIPLNAHNLSFEEGEDNTCSLVYEMTHCEGRSVINFEVDKDRWGYQRRDVKVIMPKGTISPATK